MLKDFSPETLAMLIDEQIEGQFVVTDQPGASFLVYEHKPALWIFSRLALVAKVCTESFVHVTKIVGNPGYESLVNRLATLLVAEFKTINYGSDEPGSIAVDFFQQSSALN